MAINPLLQSTNKNLGINSSVQPQGMAPQFTSTQTPPSILGLLGQQANSPYKNAPATSTSIPQSFAVPTPPTKTQTSTTDTTNTNITPPVPQSTASPTPQGKGLATPGTMYGSQPPQGAAYQKDGVYYDANGQFITDTKAPISGASPVYTPFAPNTGLYGQLISGLANAPQQNPAVQEAIKNLQDIKSQYAATGAQIMGTPGLGQQEAQGEQGLLNQLYTQKVGAAQEALANALQSQNLQQQALGQAAGFAAPQAVPYSSQFVSPFSGQPVIQGGTTGNLNDAASLYASRVLSGGMTYDQAVQALNQYGPVGQQALTQALGPDFSTIQSNVNAAIQGSLGPSAQNAANQLTNLQKTLESSPGAIKTGIPVLNSLLKTLSSLSGVGAGGTQALNSALVDARAAMANALGVANNSTPSTYDAYVQALLPDGLTPEQLSNAITQFNNQIQGKLQAYQTSGTTEYQPPQSTGTQGGISYDF